MQRTLSFPDCTEKENVGSTGSSPPDYVIHTDVKCDFLQLIDVDKLRREVTEPWFNQTLCRVNDCVVRLGVIQGEFHWHKHDNEDEFFYVVAGQLLIDVDGRTVELNPN